MNGTAHKLVARGRRSPARRGQRFAAMLVAAALTVAGPTVAGGALVSVTVSVEPAVATIGDRLHYSLLLDSADGVEVVLPDVVAGLAPFEVLDVTLSEPELRGGRVLERRDYFVAVFETGDLFVPALEFAYVTADGDSGVVLSDSLAVRIESVLPEVREDQEVGPLDIKPPIELPRRIWPYVVAVLVGAAVVVGLYSLRKWLRKRKAGPVEEKIEEPPVPRTAAHVVALERLDALEREDLPGRGDVPGFYVGVTEIVRFYLRDRFGVDAIDMTTSELPPAMRDARIGEEEIAWSDAYLVHADLAKFARHVPATERARKDLGEARRFVERTRFRGEEGGDGGDGGDGADAAAEVRQ